ncbi:hypothetical protein DINM_001075 [Dirofilaria immitis]|nr:hypothetical protein [Dirofilaria immitis]
MKKDLISHQSTTFKPWIIQGSITDLITPPDISQIFVDTIVDTIRTFWNGIYRFKISAVKESVKRRKCADDQRRLHILKSRIMDSGNYIDVLDAIRNRMKKSGQLEYEEIRV